MQFKDLMEEAKEELDNELKSRAIVEIKQRLIEIRAAQQVLRKLEEQYEKLLEKDVSTLLLE